MSDVIVKRGDLKPDVRLRLSQNDEPVDLGAALSVKFLMKNTEGELVVNGAMQTVPGEPGVVMYEWQPADTAIAGQFKGEVEVM